MKKYHAVITGDIVDSTKIPDANRVEFLRSLEDFLNSLTAEFHTRSEMYRGDSFQIFLDDPKYSLLLATIIRGFIIAQTPDNLSKARKYDARIAIGIGTVNELTPQLSISTGEAFILSGHTLDDMKKRDRININTFNETITEQLSTYLDVIVAFTSSWTTHQARYSYLKLMGYDDGYILKKYGITLKNLKKVLRSANYSVLDHLLDWTEKSIEKQITTVVQLCCSFLN